MKPDSRENCYKDVATDSRASAGRESGRQTGGALLGHATRRRWHPIIRYHDIEHRLTVAYRRPDRKIASIGWSNSFEIVKASERLGS
jgi:hypothetical protein